MPELGKERGRGRGQRKRPRPGAQLARLEAAQEHPENIPQVRWAQTSPDLLHPTLTRPQLTLESPMAQKDQLQKSGPKGPESQEQKGEGGPSKKERRLN